MIFQFAGVSVIVRGARCNCVATFAQLLANASSPSSWNLHAWYRQAITFFALPPSLADSWPRPFFGNPVIRCGGSPPSRSRRTFSNRLVSRHRSDVVGCAQPGERGRGRTAHQIRGVWAGDAAPLCVSMAGEARKMIGDATLGTGA